MYRPFVGLLVLLLGIVFHVQANELHGKVIRVADGDTLTILIESIKLDMPVRLSGVDAPEKRMAFGHASKQSLSDLAYGRQAVVEWNKKDKYGRLVGKVIIDGRDINIVQVQRGMAWHFKEYAKEQSEEDQGTYAQAERDASLARVGLWQDMDPTPPWTWRKSKRSAGETVPVEEAR